MELITEEIAKDLPKIGSNLKPKTFYDCSNIHKTAKQIKEIWPLANRVQLNDVSTFELKSLQKIFTLFSHVDVPLCDENFEIVYDALCDLISSSVGISIVELLVK